MPHINIQCPVYKREAVPVTRAFVDAPDGGKQKAPPLVEAQTRMAIAAGYAVICYLQLHPQYSNDFSEPMNLAARKLDAALGAIFKTPVTGATEHHRDARQKIVAARSADNWDAFMAHEISSKQWARKGMSRVHRDVVPPQDVLMVATYAAARYKEILPGIVAAPDRTFTSVQHGQPDLFARPAAV